MLFSVCLSFPPALLTSCVNETLAVARSIHSISLCKPPQAAELPGHSAAPAHLRGHAPCEGLNGVEEENEADLLRENKKRERRKQNEGCYWPSTGPLWLKHPFLRLLPLLCPPPPPCTLDAETVFIEEKGGQKLKINYVYSLPHGARMAACQIRGNGGGGQWDGMWERETGAHTEVRRAEGRKTSGWCENRKRQTEEEEEILAAGEVNKDEEVAETDLSIICDPSQTSRCKFALFLLVFPLPTPMSHNVNLPVTVSERRRPTDVHMPYLPLQLPLICLYVHTKRRDCMGVMLWVFFELHEGLGSSKMLSKQRSLWSRKSLRDV